MDNLSMQASACLLLLYIAAGVMILEGFTFRRRGASRVAYPIALAAVLVGNLYALSALGAESYLNWYPLVAFLPLFLTTFLITRYRGFKALFIFLTATIWASPLLLAAHFISLLLGPAYGVKLVCYVALAVPMLLALKLYFRAPLKYLLDNYHRGWALFCAVPLLCASVSYYQTRYRFLYDLATFRESGPWQLSLSLLSFITYLLIVQYARQIRERLEAKATYQLVQTQLQAALTNIASLKQSERQVAVHMHDLRHHLRYIHALATEGNREEIMRYVVGIEQSIDASTTRAFCKNEAVNLILSSFQAQAERQGAAIDVRADIPERLNVPDEDLCAIISNGLENAMKAVCEVTDRSKTIELSCHTRNDQLLLEIANPFVGTVQIDNGAVRAEDGHEGLGTRSIALIVEKHGGLLSFDTQDGRFVLRAIL